MAAVLNGRWGGGRMAAVMSRWVLLLALLLGYVPPVGRRFSPEHAGPSFRIVDAATGQRLTDITYRP